MSVPSADSTPPSYNPATREQPRLAHKEAAGPTPNAKDPPAYFSLCSTNFVQAGASHNVRLKAEVNSLHFDVGFTSQTHGKSGRAGVSPMHLQLSSGHRQGQRISPDSGNDRALNGRPRLQGWLGCLPIRRQAMKFGAV